MAHTLLNLAVDPLPLQDDPDFYKVYRRSQPDIQTSSPTLPRVPASYSKLPEILTAAIKPIYNGSVPSFFTFLFQLKEWQSICHFWANATYYSMVDLLDHFINIDFDTVLFDLSQWWTPISSLWTRHPCMCHSIAFSSTNKKHPCQHLPWSRHNVYDTTPTFKVMVLLYSSALPK